MADQPAAPPVKKSATPAPAAAKKSAAPAKKAPAKSSGKKSPTKAAAEGAAAGAVGGPQAAAISGAAAGDAQRKANKSAKLAGRSPAHRILIAELIASLLIVALSPMTDKHKLDAPATFIKRLTAIAFLYVILGLVATGGRGAGKVAAAFGGLVTLSLMLSSRDIFAVIGQRFGADLNEGTAGPPDEGGSEGGFVDGGIPLGAGGTAAGGMHRP